MHLAYLHYLCSGDTAMAHVRQFSTAAADLGHRIDVHAMNLVQDESPGPSPSAGPAGVRQKLKHHFGRYLHEPKELLWNPLYVRKELALLRRNRPDVLLVRSHLLTFSPVWVARRLGLPLVFEVNSPAAESDLYLDQYAHIPVIPDWLEGWKFRQADALTVVSSSLKKHLCQRYSLAAEKVRVIPNGADHRAFTPDREPDRDVRQRLGDQPIVGFIGSFEKWHGADLLVKMVEDVARDRPAVRFLLVGDGPEAAGIRRRLDALNNRVLFTGRVPHERVPGLVACMDVGVMPESNFYGSPLKVLEWMAAGLAVVAPSYAPLTDIIENGVDGLLFPPGDSVALVKKIVQLVDEPELRGQIGCHATQKVRNSLTWSHNAEQVLGVCAEAHERKQPESAL